VKDVEFLVNEFAETRDLVREHGSRRVHVTVGVANGLRFVVRAQRFVVAKPDGDGFVTAVHRHEIEVEIDEQVALGGAAVDAKRFAVARLPEFDEVGFVFGVVVVVAVRIEVVPDLLPDHAPHLGFGHAAVKRDSDDDVYVVNAVTVEHVNENL
jgi:hypothetical protein